MVSRMLPYLHRVRQFTSPYAPSLYILAAQVKGELVAHLETPPYVMGKGRKYSEAQTRMCGEAVERVSLLASGANETWDAYNPASGETRTIVPAQFFPPHWRPKSHGCACHNHIEKASIAAVDELWERRAVQDWWDNDAQLRILTQEHTHYAEIAAHVSATRAGAVEPRQTVFCLIEGNYPTDIALAFSHDRDFDQIAIAFAAGSGTLDRLFRRALKELLTVELETADLCRAHLDGDKIEENSNRYLVKQRQAAVRARLFEDLKDARPIEVGYNSTATVPSLIVALHQAQDCGAPIWLIDMTHEFIGVPTVRAIFEAPSRNPFVHWDNHRPLPL